MEWLHPYVTLSVICGMVSALLPRGSLRDTAAMAMGLLVTLCWLDCLRDLLALPAATSPQGVLTSTVHGGYMASVMDAWQAVAGR